ncbi:MAG: DUF1800 family protein [Devosia sp.]|nr:DUF1800 family protein [Devosia sp.]
MAERIRRIQVKRRREQEIDALNADEAQRKLLYEENAKATDVHEIAICRFAQTATWGGDHVRQRLTHFWLNHFTVGAKDLTPGVIGDYWDMIYSALDGNFNDLAYRTTTHPAMLMYLDNTTNVGPHSEQARVCDCGDGLNDNLARELMELHTVTPARGYTEGDIHEAAKVLSGLVFTQHLNQSDDMPRQAAIGDAVDAMPVEASSHFDHEIVGEIGQGAVIGAIDRQHVTAIVEDGIHGVDGELELVDAAARTLRIELGRIGRRLLDIVLPVVGDLGENVLCASCRLRGEFAHDLVAIVVVLEIVRWDALHFHREAEQAQARDVDVGLVAQPPIRLLEQWQDILALIEMAHRPAAMVETDHHGVELVGVETCKARRRLRES